MTGVTTPMPRDTGLALGTLAAWQHEVLVTGQDGFAGLNIEALRTAIDKVGEVRNRWHQIPSVLPVCYGGWRRKRAFRPLLGSNGGLSRLTVAQRLLFESGHPTFEKIETMNRSVWTVKILAAEVMLLAALDWATSGTGEAGTRRHHGDCERFDIFTISSAERFSYERALEEIAEIEQTARQVREVAMASLMAPRRRAAALRWEITLATEGFNPALLLAWYGSPQEHATSAIRFLAPTLAWRSCGEMNRARGGPLRLLGMKVTAAVLCISAARRLIEAALDGRAEQALAARGYCGCAALAPPQLGLANARGE